tara:strand:+ start:1753 stop:2328 length:576 start_codon:yes stop_codon:yes gene_type:complete
MKESSNDTELVGLVSEGNVSAFEMIYRKYSKDMFVYAMNILRKKEVCEDIVQNIFVDFWTKRNDVKINNLKPYLYQAVKYQIFNYLRNKKVSVEDLTRINIIDISIDLSQKMEYEELHEEIKAQVAKLPNRCQEIFILSRYEHKTNKEISSELGISLQAVKNQISKALNFLRQNISSEEIVFYFLLFNIHI